MLGLGLGVLCMVVLMCVRLGWSGIGGVGVLGLVFGLGRCVVMVVVAFGVVRAGWGCRFIMCGR